MTVQTKTLASVTTIDIDADAGGITVDPADAVRERPGTILRWTCEHPFAIVFKGGKTPFVHPAYGSREADGGHEVRTPITARPGQGNEVGFDYGIVVLVNDDFVTLDPKVIVYE